MRFVVVEKSLPTSLPIAFEVQTSSPLPESPPGAAPRLRAAVGALTRSSIASEFPRHDVVRH